VRSFNLQIEHQCPQCGAPVTLDETDRLFTCGFCRVRSYLNTKDYFRYLLPDKAPEDKTLLYFPYWRFKGMLFSCVSDGVRQKFIDVSHQALASHYFPHSLGFRSQTQKLRFVSPETDGVFLHPDQSFDHVMQVFEERFQSNLPQPVFHQTHIGESISLIYAPYYAADKLYDAVLNEPTSKTLPPDFDQAAGAGGRPDWRLEFLPTLCPNCGWDLESANDALVLICKNCNSAWKPGNTRLQRLKFKHMPATARGEEVIYLPFWRIKADITGIDLVSFADLVKTANLPKVLKDEWQDIPFHFWSLGFKIRPQTFLPLATKITLSQPRESLSAELPEGELYPVTLPVEEAVESLKITLANFIKPRRKQYPRLNTIKITPKSYLLVYFPFYKKHHDLTQPLFKFTILKNQLKLAGNL